MSCLFPFLFSSFRLNSSKFNTNSSSVIALSKLYDLNDPLINQTQVKGDLIVPTSDRIMTRSRAKQSM